MTSFTSWCKARFFSRSKQLACGAGLDDDSVFVHPRLCLITVLLFVIASFIAEAQHPWQRPVLRDRAEVERIMGAFSGELGKLDEVVGVLNTYVHRLKTSREEEDDRLLN